MRQYLLPMRIDVAGLGFGAGQEEILPVTGGVDFGLCVAKSGPIQTKAGFPRALLPASSHSVIVLLTVPSTGSFGSLEPNVWIVSPHAGTGREMALAPGCTRPIWVCKPAFRSSPAFASVTLPAAVEATTMVPINPSRVSCLRQRRILKANTLRTAPPRRSVTLAAVPEELSRTVRCLNMSALCRSQMSLVVAVAVWSLRAFLTRTTDHPPRWRLFKREMSPVDLQNVRISRARAVYGASNFGRERLCFAEQCGGA
ncbi:hypothetical protein FXB40_24290 [Bradyrhizobium rifense]|uniref:Uncharacterized protein n=1 Tax=Bradyrhizobium rifense TaxID=515499 RepID=A0A5D3K9Y1_9BRAD|nr:hypothetical protein FXB40_24290 [Bradyrhizobium rifense]